MYYGESIFTCDNRAFRVIATADSGGYSWTAFGLLVDVESGQLYVTEDSGCSCNYFLDNPRIQDFEPVGSWQDAVNKLKEKAGDVDDSDYCLGPRDVAEFAEELMKLRPAPSPREGV